METKTCSNCPNESDTCVKVYAEGVGDVCIDFTEQPLPSKMFDDFAPGDVLRDFRDDCHIVVRVSGNEMEVLTAHDRKLRTFTWRDSSLRKVGDVSSLVPPVETPPASFTVGDRVLFNGGIFTVKEVRHRATKNTHEVYWKYRIGSYADFVSEDKLTRYDGNMD